MKIEIVKIGGGKLCVWAVKLLTWRRNLNVENGMLNCDCTEIHRKWGLRSVYCFSDFTKRDAVRCGGSSLVVATIWRRSGEKWYKELEFTLFLRYFDECEDFTLGTSKPPLTSYTPPEEGNTTLKLLSVDHTSECFLYHFIFIIACNGIIYV